MNTSPSIQVLYVESDRPFLAPLNHQLQTIAQRNYWDEDWIFTLLKEANPDELHLAEVMICLVSPEFLKAAEKHPYVQKALRMHAARSCRFIAMRVRPSASVTQKEWEQVPAIPPFFEKAINEYLDPDQTWKEVGETLHLLLSNEWMIWDRGAYPPMAPAPTTRSKPSVFDYLTKIPARVGEAIRGIFTSSKAPASTTPPSPRVVTPKEDKVFEPKESDTLEEPAVGAEPEQANGSGQTQNGDSDPTLNGGSRSVGEAEAARPAEVQDRTAEKDLVQCSIFAPRQVQKGTTALVQASIHLKEQLAEALAQAQDFDPEAESRGSKYLNARIARGDQLDLQLQFPSKDIEIDQSVQSLVWFGEANAAQFGVTIPADFPTNRLIGTVIVSLKNIPIGHIKFILHLQASEVTEEKEAESHTRVYHKAFVSYSSKDRPEVLKRTQMLKNVGIEFFQDVLHLDPGERWERALYKNMDGCDVFFLFWSKHSKASTWVQREWEYALSLQSTHLDLTPDIIPVLLEGPPVPRPPEELQHLHFNDALLYVLRGEE